MVSADHLEMANQRGMLRFRTYCHSTLGTAVNILQPTRMTHFPTAFFLPRLDPLLRHAESLVITLFA